MRSIVLNNHQSPGDILALTAAVHSLHSRYPGQFRTAVRTTAPELWLHNPQITPLGDPGATGIRCRYPLIHRSNQEPITFLHAFCRDLGDQLGVPLPPAINRPVLYLSAEERGWVHQVRQHVAAGRDQPFWLLNAGLKSDFTAKGWPLESFQEVVDRLRGRVQFVQIGAAEHRHPKLRGVIDFVGRTTLRELVRLAYHAQGGVGPSTLLQHLCAAWQKPYVCLLGGREPTAWVNYPQQITLHTIGQLECCRDGACWKSRVEPEGDGDEKDAPDKLCRQPVFGLQRPAPRCLALIQPAEVVAAIERALAGGVVRVAPPCCRGCGEKTQRLVAPPAGERHEDFPRNEPVVPAPEPEFAAVQVVKEPPE